MKRVGIFFFFLLAWISSPAQIVYISDISISGNNLTKSSVILRELPFRVADTINAGKFEEMLTESRQNLLNTALFNYVTITPQYPEGTPGQEGGIIPVRVSIEVEERWYIWPILEMRLNDRNMSSWIKKMDWKRVTLYSGVKISNMFGLGHRLEARGMSGWDKGLDLSYSRVSLDKKKKTYLSGEAYAMFYKHIDYMTLNDKPQHLSSDNGFMMRSYGGSVSLTYRPHIRWKATADISFDYSKVSEEVLSGNPDYWGLDSRFSRTFSLALSAGRDDRDYSLYPTKGRYASLSMKLEESNNFSFIKGQIFLDFQYYTKISERWMTSSSVKICSSLSNKYSYIHSKAVGYQTANVTGYELYVIDGQHYITQNNSLRYLILPQRIVHLGHNPKWRKFNKPHFTVYGKLLCDFGYVFQKKGKAGDNSLPNTFLAGAGAGVDLVTYYDIVINLGYAVNIKGKGSFLFGFRAPIF